MKRKKILIITIVTVAILTIGIGFGTHKYIEAKNLEAIQQEEQSTMEALSIAKKQVAKEVEIREQQEAEAKAKAEDEARVKAEEEAKAKAQAQQQATSSGQNSNYTYTGGGSSPGSGSSSDGGSSPSTPTSNAPTLEQIKAMLRPDAFNVYISNGYVYYSYPNNHGGYNTGSAPIEDFM